MRLELDVESESRFGGWDNGASTLLSVGSSFRFFADAGDERRLRRVLEVSPSIRFWGSLVADILRMLTFGADV